MNSKKIINYLIKKLVKKEKKINKLKNLIKTSKSTKVKDTIIKENQNNAEELPESTIPLTANNETIINIDGSFDPDSKICTYAINILNGNKIRRIRGKCTLLSEEKPSSQTGETTAAIMALNWLKQKNINKAIIGYDCENIAIWIKKPNKSKRAQWYSKHMNKLLKHIDVTFVKIKAHTGDLLNELADFDAKEALKKAIEEGYKNKIT